MMNIYILNLPSELLKKVASHLDPKSLCTFGTTCSLIHEATEADFVWLKVAARFFPQYNISSEAKKAIRFIFKRVQD